MKKDLERYLQDQKIANRRQPGRVVEPTTITREVRDGRVIEVHHVEDPPRAQVPEYRGDDLLRKFVPYFVIAILGMIVLGGLAAILGLVVPMIMGVILSIVSSFVSIILSLVASIIAGAVIAVAMTLCQTANGKGKIGRRR